jgi:hypothetical protein
VDSRNIGESKPAQEGSRRTVVSLDGEHARPGRRRTEKIMISYLSNR